eukprot:c19162_g1_i4 orf=263-670(-)
MKEMVEGKAAIQSDLHFTYSSSSMDSVRPLEALPNGIKKGVATRHSDCSWLLQQRIKGFVKVLVVGLLQGRLPVIPISKYQIRDFSCQGNENEFLLAKGKVCKILLTCCSNCRRSALYINGMVLLLCIRFSWNEI